jgi:hypothetical protein
MAAPPNIFWDPTGHLHTNALHWEGFPCLLWESLRSFGYTDPPQYDAMEYQEGSFLISCPSLTRVFIEPELE